MTTDHMDAASGDARGARRLTITFSVQLSEGQYAEIESMAKHHGVSMARIARRALRSGLTVLRQSPRLAAEFSRPE